MATHGHRKITVLIADDHDVVREGVKALLGRAGGFSVIGEVANGRDAVALAIAARPDVVIMDVVMPELNGIEATAKLRAQAPGIKVVALSMHSDRRYVRRMFSAGAAGYVLKSCGVKHLVAAIRAVHAGNLYASPAVASVVVDDYARMLDGGHGAAARALTPREREVVQLIAEGKTTKQIACVLAISQKTAEVHRTNIMGKLKAGGVADIVRYAVEEGIVAEPGSPGGQAGL